ncbi:Membrane magnesium transporter [Nymphaea thermarum]|nr:Membrane magnesium transporter [Nymphaea thermarum]
MAISFVVGVIGGLLLVHAAYSTIQYRAVLKITEEKFSAPPFNVFLEVITGLSLCLWAGLAVPGKFLSILTVSEDNRCPPLLCFSWNLLISLVGLLVQSFLENHYLFIRLHIIVTNNVSEF